jgi:signal transduction histidine kinase
MGRLPVSAQPNSQSSNSRFAVDDYRLARQAIGALERLRTGVICYRSRGEFESDGRLARVSFETFVRELYKVTAEIAPVLPKLHDTKLRNYLANSLESYRDGAFWWSKLGQTKVKRIDHHVELSVADSGIGIETEFLPYVFDRFAQAGKQGNKHTGLGLGLTIVRYFVELHGGSVTAQSEGHGKGATFTITLPSPRA